MATQTESAPLAPLASEPRAPGSPPRLPAEVEALLDAALVAELTVVNPAGRTVSYPLIPLWDGTHLFFTSAVLFSKKLRHLAQNSRVSVSLSDPVAMPGVPFHRATIQATARVLTGEDPHTSFERLLPLWSKKEPAILFFVKKRFGIPLFFERVTIELDPVRVLFWKDGNTSKPPRITEVATLNAAPPALVTG